MTKSSSKPKLALTIQDISRQSEEILKIQSQYAMKIPNNINFEDISGLSNEAVQKFKDVMPENIQQAGKISGITPANIALLVVYLKKSDLKHDKKSRKRLSWT